MIYTYWVLGAFSQILQLIATVTIHMLNMEPITFLVQYYCDD